MKCLRAPHPRTTGMPFATNRPALLRNSGGHCSIPRIVNPVVTLTAFFVGIFPLCRISVLADGYVLTRILLIGTSMYRDRDSRIPLSPF
jgi:hypothetical protein